MLYTGTLAKRNKTVCSNIGGSIFSPFFYQNKSVTIGCYVVYLTR